MRIRVSFLRSLFVLAGLALLAAPASAVSITWTFVGDPGNAADTLSNCYGANCGSVSYEYYISTYEVTNAQYAEFLNLEAASDPLGLYNGNMNSNAQGGITQSGVSGSYTYAVKPGFDDKPVNYVSFYDSLRFTNWLNNGQGSADTETGAYTLLGGTATPSNGTTVLRNIGANIFLPSENEWYKAAYYDGLSATYFDYPTGTNTATVCSAPGATPNTANCDAPGSDATDADVDGVTNVGTFTNSASPYGTFDQGGNIYEWNEQMVNVSGPGGRGLRGGSWGLSFESIAASIPSYSGASNEHDNFGFRVASLVPEPGTSLLVMTGLAGLAARQRRRTRTL
jgi:formylglycine-generating enzyme required for sulfatase activity